MNLFFRFFCVLLLFSPASLYAQAGSSLPVVFESPEAFYSSISERFSGGSQALPMLPEGVLRLPETERYVFWAELEHGRLNLLERQSNGGLTVIKIIPMSIGINGFGKELEGDKRTPVGVYYFTSYLTEEQLIDFYGKGAYPLNYPNAFDRLQQRTGFGIWLHGLPRNTPQRPLLDSDGCVVIDNASLQALTGFIDTGRTPIILSNNQLKWIPKSEAEARSRELEQTFEQWRRAWSAIDNDLYLSFYAEDFSDFNQDLTEWSTYKRRVNNSKSSISVTVSDLSFFVDPQRPDVVSVRFFQRYRSSNYNWDGWKEQLWREADNQWQIIYEG